MGGPSIMARNDTTAPDPKMHGGCSADSSVGASVPTSSGFLQWEEEQKFDERWKNELRREEFWRWKDWLRGEDERREDKWREDELREDERREDERQYDRRMR